jgi:hypothetical protein
MATLFTRALCALILRHGSPVSALTSHKNPSSVPHTINIAGTRGRLISEFSLFDQPRTMVNQQKS